MSNVVRFLEQLGSQPELSAGDYAAAVALLDTDESKRLALLLRDDAELNRLLHGRMMMVSLVAEKEPPERAPDEQEDTPAEEEEREE